MLFRSIQAYTNYKPGKALVGISMKAFQKDEGLADYIKKKYDHISLSLLDENENLEAMAMIEAIPDTEIISLSKIAEERYDFLKIVDEYLPVEERKNFRDKRRKAGTLRAAIGTLLSEETPTYKGVKIAPAKMPKDLTGACLLFTLMLHDELQKSLIALPCDGAINKGGFPYMDRLVKIEYVPKLNGDDDTE